MRSATHAQDRSDLISIDALKAGNCDAIQQLVHTYLSVVYILALLIFGNEQEAQDAAQGALVHAYTRLRSYHWEWCYETWMLVFLATLAATVLMLVGFGKLALLYLPPDAISHVAPPVMAAIVRATIEISQDCGLAKNSLLHMLVSQSIIWPAALIILSIISLWACHPAITTAHPATCFRLSQSHYNMPSIWVNP